MSYGAHLQVIAPRQHSSFRKNIVAVANHWQHSIQFNRPEIWISNFSLQRRTRYRSTNWEFNLFKNKGIKLILNDYLTIYKAQIMVDNWLQSTHKHLLLFHFLLIIW